MKHSFNIKYLKQGSIIYLLFSCSEVYARAGGGGGGGGSGRGRLLAYLVALIWTLVFLVILYIRKKQSLKQAKKSEKLDTIWNYEALTDFTRDRFLKMQTAWMKRDLEEVRQYLTDKCYSDLRKKIDHMVFVNEINYLEDIEIKRIVIVECEDYIDDSRDTFTAYIGGKMIDYTIAQLTKSIIINAEKRRLAFMDLYTFKRNGKTWLIDEINNDPGISDLITAQHILED